jgi:hypothetical protein
MSNDQVDAVQKNIEQGHQQRLLDSHLALQRAVIYYATPIVLIGLLAQALNHSCWQNWTIVGGFVFTAVGWLSTPYLTRHGRLLTSVIVVALSMILFEALCMLLQRNGEMTALLADMIVVIYASLFSRRLLYATLGATAATLVLREIVLFIEPYEMLVMPPLNRLLYQVGFGLLILTVIGVVLRRSHVITNLLVASTQRLNDHQSRIIRSAQTMGETLEMVVSEIGRASCRERV